MHHPLFTLYVMRLKSYSQFLKCNPELVWLVVNLTALSRDAADDVTLVHTASSTFLHSQLKLFDYLCD